MAENDSTIPKPPLPEPADVPTKVVPGTDVPATNVSAKKERVAIAVSEVNLAALLGPETSNRKPIMPASASDVPSTLALLSQVQEKHLPESVPPTPAEPLTETLGSTLALLATIKENRALMRSKPPAPPEVILPEPAEEALEPAVPDAPQFRGTVFPASAPPPPAPIPRWAMPLPSSPPRLAAALAKLPGGRKSLLILGAVIAVGGVSAGLVVRNQRTAKASSVVVASPPVVAPGAPPSNTFPLQLQAELLGNGSINLRWNPSSPLIAQARDGRLVINEINQKPQTVAVSLEQLKLGHLTYQPRSEHVEFRLEVVDRSGSIAEASVLANPPATGETESARPPQTPETQTPETTALEPPPSRPQSRVFTPPSTRPPQELRTIVDTPPTLPNMAVPSLGTSGRMPAPIAPPAPTPVPAVRQIQVATSLQAAKLIKRVAPEYPALARSANLEGTVRFKAIIGTDGAIRNLEVLSGPPSLRPSALAAVRQWIYEPTLLNGKPLEVVTQIEVNFTLRK